MESRDEMESLIVLKELEHVLIEIAGQLFGFNVLAGLSPGVNAREAQGKAFLFASYLMASVADGRSKTRTLTDLRSASQRVHPLASVSNVPVEKRAFRECTEVRRSRSNAMSQPLWRRRNRNEPEANEQNVVEVYSVLGMAAFFCVLAGLNPHKSEQTGHRERLAHSALCEPEVRSREPA